LRSFRLEIKDLKRKRESLVKNKQGKRGKNTKDETLKFRGFGACK